MSCLAKGESILKKCALLELLGPVAPGDLVYFDLDSFKREPNISRFEDMSNKHGTDKCKKHSYQYIYANLFEELKEKEINFLEIGIGNGNSLLLWHEYFQNALNIFGIENNPKNIATTNSKLFYQSIDDAQQPGHKREQKIQLLEGTSTDRGRTDHFEKEFFDIIVDDGSHIIGDQLVTLLNLWDKLKINGYYIIEDLEASHYSKYFFLFKEFVFFDLKNLRDRWDDCIVVIKKIDSDDLSIYLGAGDPIENFSFDVPRGPYEK